MKRLDELNIKNKKYIIFDLDGTLIDSIGVWNSTDKYIIEKFCNNKLELQKVIDDANNFLSKCKSNQLYLDYCQYLIDKYNINLNKYELNDLRTQIANEKLSKEITFKEGSKELINTLKEQNKTLILATMTSKLQVDVYAYKNKKMNEEMNIYDVFDLVVTADDVVERKPSPEVYNKIINYYNGNNNEFIAIEDSLTGVKACNRAGIDVINIQEKYSDKDREKINELADYYTKDFYELNDIIKTKKIKKKI